MILPARARPVDGVLPLLHSWLRRSLLHPQAASLLLRGSLVTRALVGPERQAADVDYLVLRDDLTAGPLPPDQVPTLAAEIAALPDAAGPLLRILGHETIWADTPSPGVRVQVQGHWPAQATEPQTFQVDFAYGDPLAQPPMPLLIPGVGTVQACAPETLWAWKLHGLVELGRGRWRAKDLYDAYLLQTRLPLDVAALPTVTALAFSSRGTPLWALDDLRTRAEWGLAATSRRKWRTFTRHYAVQAEFLDVRNAVRSKAEEVLRALGRVENAGL